MKAKRVLILAVALFALFTRVDAASAQGTAFTYQGRLIDSGSPANGNYDFTFALFNNSSTNSGQIGGTLTNLAVGVSNGLFTAVLDFGANFPGASRWLAIGVRTNGSASFTVLNPLQELTPTPYAIYAPSAGSAASANSVAATNIAGTISLAQLPSGVITNGSGLQQLDSQTVYYTNLIGISDPGLAYRFNRFIEAAKAAGIYGNIIDGVLLRTNWQPSPAKMVTFFGKPVTNVNAAFTSQGVFFDGETAYLEFPCTVPNSNTVYSMQSINTAFLATNCCAAGYPWTIFHNADINDYTNGEALSVNYANVYVLQQYCGAGNGFAKNVINPIPSEPWMGNLFTNSILDYFRHSVAVELNGITNGYSIWESTSNSMRTGLATNMPLNIPDTVSIGALAYPSGYGGGAAAFFAGTVQYWFAFNANLTETQLKAFENALMWLDPEQAEIMFVGDSRTGNQFDTLPDASFPSLLMQSAYGKMKVGHRWTFPSQAPYLNNTNLPDMIPQYINREACPNVEIAYLFGINLIRNTPGAAIISVVTNDWNYLTGFGSVLDVFTDAINVVNTNQPYTTTNQQAFNSGVRSCAFLYNRLLSLDLLFTNAANTYFYGDGLHLTNGGCTNLTLYWQQPDGSTLVTNGGVIGFTIPP